MKTLLNEIKKKSIILINLLTQKRKGGFTLLRKPKIKCLYVLGFPNYILIFLNQQKKHMYKCIYSLRIEDNTLMYLKDNLHSHYIHNYFTEQIDDYSIFEEWKEELNYLIFILEKHIIRHI